MRTLIHSITELVTAAPPGAPDGPRRGADMGELGIIEDGAVLIDGEAIAAVGRTAEVMPLAPGDARRIDASGTTVMPGFVDCHTHLVYGGTREREFEMRCAGVSYQEIAAAGGGIRSTVRATRQATEGELYEQAYRRVQRMAAWGTTTIEAKSGYGLSTEAEVKQLRVIAELNRLQPVELVPTFLGAHEFPDEFRGPGGIDREGYLRLLCDEMIPRISELQLAAFCDIFCDEGVFTPDEARRVLAAGLRRGLRPKVHADELAPAGAAEVAGAVGAISAEHLLHPSDAGLAAMGQAGTIAVLLPGTSLTLKKPYAPARRMIGLGIPVALATDHNPGSCTIEAMPLVIGLACLYLGMTPAEAICAATINAAYAVGRGDRIGSLTPGRQADLIILDVPSHRFIPYHCSVNHVQTVIKHGAVLVDRG